MSDPTRTNGNAVYLRAITEDILGWSDPRKRLQKALAGDDFLLYAQRIRPLQPGLNTPVYSEMLLRLREEEDHMLPPGGFFPVAEALGMLEDIDRWVVRNAIAWCAQSADDAGTMMYSINLSCDSLCNPAFAAHIRAQIDATGIAASRLCFEIAETDTLAQPQEVRHFIAALKPLGCRFAQDHFGSVKVSFAHIRDLPVDYLKIDGHIIQNMLKSPGDLARARAISLTCQRLGMRTIALSVESREVLAQLVEIGFDSAQGFGISRPRPLDKLGPE